MTENVLTVVVLAGGISHEREISLHSGHRVADAIAAQGHRVIVREPDATLIDYLIADPPDVVWPALHGASGEDGSLRALLDAVGVPYVGSDSHAAGLAWYKPSAKTLVERNGVATPESVTLARETFRELGAASVLGVIRSYFDGPLVVKPSQGGSAQGVSIVEHDDELPRAMVDAYTYSDVVLVERKITGVEIAVSVLDTDDGPTALPAVEIAPLHGVYGFEERYNAGETRFYTPARIDEAVAARASDAAITAHRILGLRHLSRIDFIVDADGVPWFLEANVLPGFTETSLFPLAIRAAGLNSGDVCVDLARRAIADRR